MSHISSSIQSEITILNLYQFFLLFVLLFELTFHSECNEEKPNMINTSVVDLTKKKLNDKKTKITFLFIIRKNI